MANLYDANGHPFIQCNIRDITQRKRSEEHVKLLMAEVNHRAKNLLAVVQAFGRQTAKHGDPATFLTRLSDRIEGLAAGQDLLVADHWQGVDVMDVVNAQLSHFKDLIGTRVLIEGPRGLTQNKSAAQGIGMALHELATNAPSTGHFQTAMERCASRGGPLQPRYRHFRSRGRKMAAQRCWSQRARASAMSSSGA